MLAASDRTDTVSYSRALSASLMKISNNSPRAQVVLRKSESTTICVVVILARLLSIEDGLLHPHQLILPTLRYAPIATSRQLWMFCIGIPWSLRTCSINEQAANRISAASQYSGVMSVVKLSSLISMYILFFTIGLTLPFIGLSSAQISSQPIYSRT